MTQLVVRGVVVVFTTAPLTTRSRMLRCTGAQTVASLKGSVSMAWVTLIVTQLITWSQ